MERGVPWLCCPSMKGWSCGSTRKLPPPLFVVADGIGSSIAFGALLFRLAATKGSASGWTI